MRPKERRETSEQGLFRSRRDQMIDLGHALARLTKAIELALPGREVGRGLQ